MSLTLLLLVSLGYFADFAIALIDDPNRLLPHMLNGLALVALWLLMATAMRARR